MKLGREQRGETIPEARPKEWLVPGANLIVEKRKTYDLRLEWSNESQVFEIIDLYPQ